MTERLYSDEDVELAVKALAEEIYGPHALRAWRSRAVRVLDALASAGRLLPADARPETATCRHCPAPSAAPDADCVCCCHRAHREAEVFRRMSRGDRRRNMCLDSMVCDDGAEHRWQPVSFRFESQILDPNGRVVIRQPDLNHGRVYVVCMECRAHTYVETEWAGYFLGGPDYNALEPVSSENTEEAKRDA